MQYPQHLDHTLADPIGHNEWNLLEDPFAYIGYLRLPAGTGEALQLLKGVEDVSHDLTRSGRPNQPKVVLMNRIQITLSFFGQCDARHDWPT